MKIACAVCAILTAIVTLAGAGVYTYDPTIDVTGIVLAGVIFEAGTVITWMIDYAG